MQTKICLTCGTYFTTAYYTKTCSSECARKFRGLQVSKPEKQLKKVCVICGKTFLVVLSQSIMQTCGGVCGHKLISMHNRGKHKNSKLRREAKRLRDEEREITSSARNVFLDVEQGDYGEPLGCGKRKDT